MMNWRELQDSTAKLFRELGCDAAVEAVVEGARAVHELDVQVKFRQFGIETTWVIECKSWRRNVTKEKVMALKAIIEDVGADRGVIVSASGFQAGAIRAAATSNITLTDLEGLRALASEDLQSLALRDLETRVYILQRALMSFFVREQLGPNHWKTKRAHPAIDGSAITKCGGHLVVLQGGLESARLQQPPYRYGWDQSGNRTLHTSSLQEFIAHAREAIERAEGLVAEQQAAMSDGG